MSLTNERIDLLYRVVWTKLDKVMGLERNNVGEKIATRERQILNDDIETVIRILDARNGHVANLDGVRISKIAPKRTNKDLTLSMMEGKITFLISIQSSPLNLRFPSESNNKSLVNLAQSSPNLLLSGSALSALNQSPETLNRLSKWERYLSS